MNDQKKLFVVAIKKMCAITYIGFYACAFSDEGTKGDCYLNFAIQDFALFRVIALFMFSSRIGYGDKSFLRECANWHGHLVPDMEISWY